MLVAVAADDPEPDNRYQALQSLWYSAADGVDGNGAAREALELALDDWNPAVARLAQKALDDLSALELTRAAIQ